MEQLSLEKINADVENLKKVVASMKEEIEDCCLTNEEEDIVEKARKEFEDGETTSLEDLKKELDV